MYCCPACNRLKGDFWPPADPHTARQRLLHPGRDDLAQHLRAEPDGRLTALTHTGAFHIERLRLNRRPLLVLRQARQEVAGVRESLEAVRVEQERLRARIAALEQELHDVLTQLARLLAR